MEYLATFYTHYGAMRFHKHCNEACIPAKMMPVPRELSSSCGVCVRIESAIASKIREHEDMESCYSISPCGEYKPLEG